MIAYERVLHLRNHSYDILSCHDRPEVAQSSNILGPKIGGERW